VVNATPAGLGNGRPGLFSRRCLRVPCNAPLALVAEWAQADTDVISAAFRNAFAASRIVEQANCRSAVSRHQSARPRIHIPPLAQLFGRDLRVDGDIGAVRSLRVE